ncbi:hypothetical protein SAMN04487885_12242 [Clostridium cadaveris]|uniref:Zn-dependent PLC domain-containing protein n=1 Tax=Clostridium cadaveris TaxID=1529 RepID=A0A1I2NJX9_9CLOT|nr:hypothetical protein [Clostridium cadaveris]MDM8312918.1 hypothetical protein [Clostridium cadaveris]SFG04112.1 hypothetical protein SAMN04487885_12242 [Clostridium cadaveris]
MKRALISLFVCFTLICGISAPCIPTYSKTEIPKQGTYSPISTSFNKEKLEDISNGSDDIMGSGKGFEPLFHNDTEDARWESGGIDHTHQYLCARGIKLFLSDVGADYDDIIYPYVHVILNGADAPDIDENEFLYVHHFYHYIFKKNYAFVGATAKDKFIQHSQLALELFTHDKHEAFDHLGRAIHYLEDINEPHHASNLTAVNSNHVKYEKWADKNRAKFKLSNATLYSDYRDMNFSKSLNTLAERCAANAYNMKDYATAKKCTPWGGYSIILDDYDKWGLSADSTMTYAQDAISAYLYIFFKEAKANSFIRLAQYDTSNCITTDFSKKKMEP